MLVYKWLAEHIWIIDVIVPVVVALVMIEIIYRHWMRARSNINLKIFSVYIITLLLCLLKIFNIFIIKSKLISLLVSSHSLVLLMILCLILDKSSIRSRDYPSK